MIFANDSYLHVKAVNSGHFQALVRKVMPWKGILM